MLDSDKKSILIFFFNITSVFSQVSIDWVARYDGGYGDDAGLAITTDDSGYVYVTGNSYGSQTRQDLVVLKYSNTGVTQWTRRIADTVNNNFRSGFAIELDKEGNVIVGGPGVLKYDRNGNTIWRNENTSIRYMAVDEKANIYGCDGNDYYKTTMYNFSGDTVWSSIYPYVQHNYPNRPNDICIDREKNVIVTGVSRLSGTINDYATVKYSNTRNLIWVRRYDGGNEDAAYAITSDDSNNVYVTGWNRNNTTDILTIKYSSEGDTIWKEVYDGGGFDVGYDIEVDSLGCVYVGGVTNSSSYITIKYDINGNMLWSEIQPGQLIPYSPKLKLDKNRNVYMSFVSYRPGLYSNYAVVKYNTEGIQQWVAEYNNGGVSLKYI